MNLTDRQNELVRDQMNDVIRECLWGPDPGLPDGPVLIRAATAYLVLKAADLFVQNDADVVDVLGGNNVEGVDYLALVGVRHDRP